MKDENAKYGRVNLTDDIILDNTYVCATSQVLKLKGVIPCLEHTRGDTVLVRGKKNENGEYPKVAALNICKLPKRMAKQIDDIYKSNDKINNVKIVRLPKGTRIWHDAKTKTYNLIGSNNEVIDTVSPLPPKPKKTKGNI